MKPPSSFQGSSSLIFQALAMLLLAAGVARAQGVTSYRFDFGPGPTQPGYIPVVAATTYQASRGYGFDFNVPVTCVDRGGNDSLKRDICYSNKYFYFSVDLPEGNYQVTLTLGDKNEATVNTVKAESRRLFVEKAQTAAGEFSVQKFTVNRRNVAISTGGNVGINDRERGGLNWDGNKLTLEFNNTRPSVAALEIVPADKPVQVFLAGNSTVCDWATEDEASWGQMMTRFFKPSAVVVNMAESGKTGTSFINDRRLDKIMSLIKAGDYLFAEFAHNDMGSLTIAQYQNNFVTFITKARSADAVPVLVTPTPRRQFENGKIRNSFVNGNGDYIAAMKSVATSQNAVLLDLNACVSTFLETLGPTESAKAYWVNNGAQDNTHFNNYGAYEVAKCVSELVRAQLPDLAAHLAADFTGFDPKSPDPLPWSFPLSADTSVWHAKPTSLKPPGSQAGRGQGEWTQRKMTYSRSKISGEAGKSKQADGREIKRWKRPETKGPLRNN